MSVLAAAVTLMATAFVTGEWQVAPAAQKPAAPQQAATRKGPGTASIAGTVTSEADGTPLPRARVVVRSVAGPARVVLADTRGAFKIDALPAGDYLVVALRTGYVLPYAVGGPVQGVAVRIGNGESREGLALALQRAGTIPGRLLDEDGTPLSGADVEAHSLRAVQGQPLSSTASARTDDRGEFRLTGLPAGQYFVVARDTAFSNVADESGALRYAPTYHPGVLSSAEAQPVSVIAGQDSARIEFRLQIVRPSRISGTITTPGRRPLLSGAILLVGRDALVNIPLLAEDVELLPDGRFSLRNVPPGRFQIRARAEVVPKQVMWFSSYAVTVDGRDVDGVSMILTPGAAARGRVDWTHGPTPKPSNYDGMRVRAHFADGTSFGDSLTGVISSDGTFSIRGVMAGSHFFTLDGAREPWVVTTVLWRGRDILDQPTNINDGEQLDDLHLVLSAVSAELRGTVRDAGGRPAGDMLVVTSAPPPAVPSPANPRFRATRTDKDGRYRLSGLPAGDYRIAAVSGMDELVAHRREWLGRLSASGTPVSLAREGVRTLDLTALQAETLAPPVAR
jgi:hypothetical protein